MYPQSNSNHEDQHIYIQLYTKTSGGQPERALEWTLWAPGLEGALKRTLWSPGLEQALERTLWAPGLERAPQLTPP